MSSIKELEDSLRFVCSVEFWRMGIQWSISLLISYFMLFTRAIFGQKPKPFKRFSHDMSSLRPVCVITGATSGLGEAAAHALAREGFYVVLVGRSSGFLSKTMKEIKKRNGDARLKAFEVDLSSFKSLLKFKDSLQQWLLDSNVHSSIQLLINNAGILATSHRLTPEGFDQMMTTNYLGAVFLTKLLLPILQSSPVPARIVNVTSFTHRCVSDMQVDKDIVSGKCFSRSKKYPFSHIYEKSKLCLLLFSYELHRQLCSDDRSSCVSVITADPGLVETNILREVPTLLSSLAIGALKLLGLLQSPENGVSSILDAVLAPSEAAGLYFFGGGGRTLNSSALSYNKDLATELWITSSDLFLESQLALAAR